MNYGIYDFASDMVKAWDDLLPEVSDISKIDSDLLLAMGQLRLALRRCSRGQLDDDSVRYWAVRAFAVAIACQCLASRRATRHPSRTSSATRSSGIGAPIGVS